MSFTQLTLTSPFLAGETHCIRTAPGHNWPLWELSPRMSLWPPELEYACGITLGRSYDSRTFSREKGAPGRCGKSVPQRGADGVVRMWAVWLPHRKEGAPLPAQRSSERYCKCTLGRRVGERKLTTKCPRGQTAATVSLKSPICNKSEIKKKISDFK